MDLIITILPVVTKDLSISPRLQFFYRDASSALLQLVNQWLNFTYSRSHVFRYERKNTNPTLVRIELTTSALAGVQLTYWTTLNTKSDMLDPDIPKRPPQQPIASALGIEPTGEEIATSIKAMVNAKAVRPEQQ